MLIELVNNLETDACHFERHYFLITHMYIHGYEFLIIECRKDKIKYKH